LCPAGWLKEQSITKHWFQSVRTRSYSWTTGRNSSIPGSWVSLHANEEHFCDCYRNVGYFLFGLERVKRFVKVHLHCIVSNLKIISKMLTLPPPLEKFLLTPMQLGLGEC